MLIGALALTACGDDDASVRWHQVDGELDRAALAVTGTSDSDVVVVGGPLGATGTALALHYDGDAWTEFGQSLGGVTLWWSWIAPDTGDVWLVGEQGTVARYDGSTVETFTSGTTSTLFGVWGTAADNVWIVGGDPIGNGDDDVVLHWNGSDLTAETVPARGAALFKVWGAGADDVFISGEGGTILHRTASGWADVSVSTVSSLLTVHGCSASDVYAVGGQSAYYYDGTSWAELSEPEILGIVNGVSCGANAVLMVGNAGLKLRLDMVTGQWINDGFEKPFDQDLHGAWVSPTGELWAVGGNFNVPAEFGPRIGRIGVYAASPPPATR